MLLILHKWNKFLWQLQNRTLYIPFMTLLWCQNPVYPMTSSMLCTLALIMKDTENVKNYCKSEDEPNSILPRYHIMDNLWFIAYSEHSHIHCSLPSETKGISVNTPLHIIKLNMSCTATSSYLTSLSYSHNESKFHIQDQFIDNRKSYNRSNLQIWKPFISTVPNFTKKISLQYWKTLKRFPCNT